MRQVLHDLWSGTTSVAEVPAPGVRPGHVLIETSATLISAGTERSLVDFGRAGLLGKMRQQPERVQRALEKARTDGVLATVDAIRARLEQPLALGYCNVGRVVALGAGVEGLRVGQRVVSNGAHAEVVCVPSNLCAPVPEGVSDESACFAVLAAVGLHGVRLAEPTLGETFVVSGLGLLGLLVVQLLRAHGVRVLGIDPDPARCALAERFGATALAPELATAPPAEDSGLGDAGGVDGVIIAAQAPDKGPLSQAARLCRRRGRIVLAGVVALELDRALFYDKELSFRVACSYGPGRYDRRYEEQGQDYPLPYVRWTAQRNFAAVLGLMAEGRLDTASLVSHRFDLSDSVTAYQLICEPREPTLGVLLSYGPSAAPEGPAAAPAGPLQRTLPVAATTARSSPSSQPGIALIGAGAFARAVLWPALRHAGARLQVVASRSGAAAAQLARRAGAGQVTTDIDAVLSDQAVQAVVIATRHDSHAELACRALRAGKDVYVAKPLAIDEDQLAAVEAAYHEAAALRGQPPLLLVGFNRRFAPHARRARALVATLRRPQTVLLTINAGAIPSEHWVHDRAIGGGRLIGEACHFIDLLRFLVGQAITRVDARRLGGAPDSAAVTLTFADGSTGVLLYLSQGHRAFPKERAEIYCGGRVIRLDNWRRLALWGWPAERDQRLLRQDKGHRAEAAAFLAAVAQRGGSPVPLTETLEVSRATLLADARVTPGTSHALPGSLTDGGAAGYGAAG